MKTKLVSNLIEKYSINGLIDTVKWETEKSNCNVKFCSPDKTLTGEIQVPNIELPDGVIGVYSTNILSNIIGIMNDEITLTNNEGKSLLVEDKETKAVYSLSEPSVIDSTAPVPKVKGDVAFDIEIKLNSKFYDQLSKAKKALPDISHIVFDGGDTGICNAIIGYSNNNTTRITYSVQCTLKNSKLDLLGFNLNYIKDIMQCNSDILDSGVMEISNKGLMRISFKKDGIQSTYYLVKINFN